MAYKTYITVIFTHLVFKLSKTKTYYVHLDYCWYCRQGKLYSICSTPELSERNFCDALEI